MRTDAQALRWWSDRRLEGLARQFRQVMSDWSGAWGVPAPDAVRCHRAHEWQASWQGDWTRLAGGQVLLQAAVPQSQIHLALFDEHGPAQGEAAATVTLAMQLAQQAWQELRASLCALCGVAMAGGGEDGTVARLSEVPWSGAVIVECIGAHPAIALRLSPDCAARMIDAHTGALPKEGACLPVKTGLREALTGTQLHLQVELSAVEIDLGSLQTLATGDVICLRHMLDRPLSVRTGSGAVLCSAYLGRHEGRLAVALVREGAIPDVETQEST